MSSRTNIADASSHPLAGTPMTGADIVVQVLVDTLVGKYLYDHIGARHTCSGHRMPGALRACGLLVHGALLCYVSCGF